MNEYNFHLQVSDSLHQLADQLSDEIRSANFPVFLPVHIVTQTEGMNSWLKQKIASRTGIAANIRFLKPNDIINQIYFILQGPARKTLSSHDLNWLLYKALADPGFVAAYPEIAAYYKTGSAYSEVKRMALAGKIADLFDQYQIYRPDMIEAWNQDKLMSRYVDEKWQKILWQKAKSMSEDHFPDKTLIGKYIFEALKNPDKRNWLQQKLPIIYLFGISVLTEYHLEIFQHLSQCITINFLLLNPAPTDYWYEDKSDKLLYFLKKIGRMHPSEENTGNPLLTSWGRVLQDTFFLLFKHESLVNSYHVIGDSAPGEDTLLQKIHLAISLNTRPLPNSLSSAYLDDKSLVINNCFGPVREVESLYNYLVYLIDKKKEALSGRDIIVMVSDIDLYASYIKAVFDNAPYRFPYTIADESFVSSDTISHALSEILSLTEDTFTSEAVMRLLDFTSIQNRLQITQTSLLRRVIDEANIRFGMEGSLEDDSLYVSWAYGLKRIMYGLCISGGNEYGSGPESFFPLDTTESSESYDIIRFVHFADTLITSLKQRKEARTVAEWIAYAERVLHTFIINKEENQEEDYSLLLSRFEEYNTIEEVYNEPVSYEVFMHNFIPSLAEHSRSQAFAGGGITFCSLIPMRSIPFKVVALLGMNFDKFPRRDKKTSFNLIEKERRKGDRNIKENDKHLFLETILSAKNYLYISYTGQNPKDNSILPPSILIDELLDYIEGISEEPEQVRKSLVTQQPLHAFSTKYKLQNDRFFTYLQSRRHPAQDIFTDTEAVFPEINRLSLSKLISFLKSPVKGYYRDRLKIQYEDDAVMLPVTEVFEVNKLEEWSLKRALLREADENTAAFRSEYIKKGHLPLKNMAKVVVQNITEEIGFAKTAFWELIDNQSEAPISLEIELDGVVLHGTVRDIYGESLIAASFSKNEKKYLLEAWINYLMLAAGNISKTLYFISNHQEAVCKAAPVSAAEARKILTTYIQFYRRGMDQLYPFDLSFQINPADFDKDADAFQKAMDKTLYETFERGFPPCTDLYLINEYRAGSFTTENGKEAFREAAELIIKPLGSAFPDYPFSKK